MEYMVKFNGRKAGALGIHYRIIERVQLEDPQVDVAERIRDKLYENYEGIGHISYENLPKVEE